MNVIHPIIAIGIGVLLIFCGLDYFRRAQKLADMMAARLAAHPRQRFWLPARSYSSKKFFWQLRMSAVGTIAIGVVFIASPIVGLIQHL